MKYINTYIIFIGIFIALLPDSVGFAEQWRTFYWDAQYCCSVIEEHGVWQLISDFFVQFLATRWSAACLLALPATVVSGVLLSGLQRLAKRCFQHVKPLVLTLVLSALAIGMTSVLTFLVTQGRETRFRGQMCLVEDQNWEKIIGQCKNRKVNNLLELNMLNLSLAETGQLQKRLREQPCQDVNSLFVLQIHSPYVAALLSDIYWSMGEISMSQMYAFEANEKMNNLSPRLLKRLVLTNIVFGYYEVAAKYLNWLDKTLFYHAWSAHYRQLLNDVAVNKDLELRLKRACIPAQNVFPSAQSVMYDLEQILATNPEHATSAEYLSAIKRLYSIK